MNALTTYKRGREIKKLARAEISITENQSNFTKQYHELTITASNVSSMISKLNEESFETTKDVINALNLADDYKTKLKTEIDRSKKDGITDLMPLRTSAEKLLGNMQVTQIKAKIQLAVIQGKRQVLNAGLIQVEALTNMRKETELLDEHIKTMLEEVESINRVSSNVMNEYNKGKDVALPDFENPLNAPIDMEKDGDSYSTPEVKEEIENVAHQV